MAKKKTAENAKLELWRQRLSSGDDAYEEERGKMDHREHVYRGERTVKPLVPGDTGPNGQSRETSHVRNIVFENIESQVSSSIPQPKVTPRRKEDEPLADIIEHFLRNELDRLPMETLNDMAERTVPIQGGCGWLIDWDNTKRSHSAVGEVTVELLHPKQFVPQPGVYTGLRDMDWFIVKVPTTRGAVQRRYGVTIESEYDTEPELRSADDADHAEDALTQYVGYAVGNGGGIDRFSWVGETVLEDIEDYQARRQPVCRRCGRVRPLPGQIIANEGTIEHGDGTRELAGWLAGRVLAGEMAEGIMNAVSPSPAGGPPRASAPTENGPSWTPAPTERTETAGVMMGVEVTPGAAPEPKRYDGGRCPWCGAEDWTDEVQDFEQVLLPMTTSRGVQIPGMHPELQEDGTSVMRPTLIPFYKPDRFPIVLQRSVSVYGQLLGSSDVDVIEDQQNTINRMHQKIIDRLVKAGTRITLPPESKLRTDPNDGERWFLENAADKSLIDVYEFSGDVSSNMAYLAQVYEESRQILGITDSFQGRRDATATSGKAKEFAAAQSAGRLESKRIMKQAAYAEMFEVMFQLWLAYSDEPRPVSWKDSRGATVYSEFNRYDFLEQDSDGTYWWNDLFLFSCDTSAPLAGNREAMWQETRMNLQTGAFGDPANPETLILFWTKMQELHYPGAADTRSYLEDQLERQRAMQAQQAQVQQAPLLQPSAAQQAQPSAAQAVLGGQRPIG